MFSTTNTKTSYTPVTVGTMSLGTKNGSPKINYFSPSPPASPSLKVSDYPNQQNNKNASLNAPKQNENMRITDFINSIKANIESKNLEIFDYYWFLKDIYILCIYNNVTPMAIYIQNDFEFEDIILNLKENPDDIYIVDLIDLVNENVFEKSHDGICIKLNDIRTFYKYVNKIDNEEIRHSIIPLITLSELDQLPELHIERKYENILNTTLKSTTNDLEKINLLLQESLNVNNFRVFTNELFGNIQQIINKIISLKKSKKTIMDNIEYYKVNKISVPQNDIENLFIINSKLINYYAYYEKYLSYIVYSNKIYKLLSDSHKFFELMNKNLLS